MKLTRLSLLAMVVCVPLFAQNNGVSANGTFQFGGTTINFNARQHSPSDAASGEMSFSGPASFANQDVDGDGSATPAATTVTFKVKFDCLSVNVAGTRASMSGKITESSLPELVGRQSILAVEDNGEGSTATGADRFTWGVYRSQAIDWTPADAENPDDTGWFLTWMTSDAERPDDVPVPSKRTTTFDCHAFPLASYSLDEVPEGGGNIQVKLGN